MGGKLRYAYLDEEPVIFDDDSAFHLSGNRWVPLHLADAMCKARLLTKAEFKRYARAAPSLPNTAFH